MPMRLAFIGADHEVTGSCHYLEVGNKHILVDYGMEQGGDTFENANLSIDERMEVLKSSSKLLRDTIKAK